MACIKRRAFLVSTAALLAAPIARAQSQKVRKIGYLSSASMPEMQRLDDALRLGLREQGWIHGRDYVMEYRWAYGKLDRLPQLTHELIAAGTELIIAPTDIQVRVAKEITTTIPIVFTAAGDPVGTGLVASYARPGGNITGLTIVAELGAKRLELLREAVPRLSRVAVIWHKANPTRAKEFSVTEAAAQKFGIAVQSFPLEGASPDFKTAFSTMKAAQAQALIVLGDNLTFSHKTEIAALAAAHKIPAMWEGDIFMDSEGTFMSYGPLIVDNWRRAGVYIVKILRGTKPADLPVEQPTTFELIINMKTARALGLTIPQSMLLRANRVIE